MARIVLALAASSFYGLATVLKCRFIFGLTTTKVVERGAALLAIMLHACLLYLIIDSESGQNLTFFNVLAQVAWLIALISWVLSFWRSLSNLSLLTYPFAILTICLALLFPGKNIIATASRPFELFHILLAMSAFSVLCLAGMQALLSVIQERLLAYKEGFALLDSMPALETTERLLFRLLGVGFVLLSIVLISSFYFFDNPFSPKLLQKTIITIITWLVFSVLLLGRCYYGWRGAIAIHWTGIGILLILGLLILSALGINL